MLVEAHRSFTHYPPNSARIQRHKLIRKAAQEMAAVLITNTPVSPELEVAIEKLNEVVFWANAGIARQAYRGGRE